MKPNGNYLYENSWKILSVVYWERNPNFLVHRLTVTKINKSKV